ncbi:MAG: histidine phosphatase family protein [Deltaproteobacteria bacterium]|nr:histidine phosphatase family protein [Deltaproteobacteria bacterium]
MPAAATASEPDIVRRLTVVRHAKSSWKDEGQTDFERPLNRRGERDAPEMGRRLSNWAERPTLVVASTARRAQQTTEALIAGWTPRPPIVWQPDLYLASADQVLASVLDLDAAHLHVMLVGHNPGLMDFANRFGDAGLESLPTCGVVRLRLWVPEWSDADWGVAHVEHVDTPKSQAPPGNG